MRQMRAQRARCDEVRDVSARVSQGDVEQCAGSIPVICGATMVQVRLAVCRLLSFSCQRGWTPRIETIRAAATRRIVGTKGHWGVPDFALEALPRIRIAKRHKQHKDIAEVSGTVCGRPSPNVSRWKGRGNTITTQLSSCVRGCATVATLHGAAGGYGQLWRAVCEGCRRCRTVGLTMRDCWPAVELLVHACRFVALQQRAILCSSDFIHVEDQNELAKR